MGGHLTFRSFLRYFRVAMQRALQLGTDLQVVFFQAANAIKHQYICTLQVLRDYDNVPFTAGNAANLLVDALEVLIDVRVSTC